ncbi:MAG: glycosyltransferase family 1 protein [Bacteroidetes bacterium]|nr:glycosyltransferase family 1 protein [Bacteroidota bacterium]
MQNKQLHIVSFNVPFPANYGGVIDVYHKIRCLHQLGVKVHLHCFEYGREEAPELDEICASVNYYPRKSGILYSLHFLPFIVLTRKSDALVNNLMKDDFPIILEGLHCCYLLDDARLLKRFKVFRESNIEHEYYYHLFMAETKLWQKIFYYLESLKLKRFEKIVAHAQLMLIVSQSDTDYFKKNYPTKRVEYLPSFHPNDAVESLAGKGEYILYHGNLAVSENYLAAAYILKEIASKSNRQFIIAGLNPSKEIVKQASLLTNVTLIANPDDAQMKRLVQEAHINMLLTFQETGLKLKLLNVLYSGRFCLVNTEMLAGTGLASLCEIGANPQEMIAKIEFLFTQEFEVTAIEKRKMELNKNYSNAANAEKLMSLVF